MGLGLSLSLGSLVLLTSKLMLLLLLLLILLVLVLVLVVVVRVRVRVRVVGRRGAVDTPRSAEVADLRVERRHGLAAGYRLWRPGRRAVLEVHF